MSVTQWRASVSYGLGPYREIRLSEVGGQERAHVWRFDDRRPSVGYVPSSDLAERRLREEYGGEHAVVTDEVVGE